MADRPDAHNGPKVWPLLEQRTQTQADLDRWLEKACDERDAAEKRVRELEAELREEKALRERLMRAVEADSLADCNRRNRPEGC